MYVGQVDGEFIQVTGEFDKREAIDFCVQDLNRKRLNFGVCEQAGKFFVARSIVDDETIGMKANIVTTRSDRVDIHGNPRGIIRKDAFYFIEWYSDGGLAESLADPDGKNKKK